MNRTPVMALALAAVLVPALPGSVLGQQAPKSINQLTVTEWIRPAVAKQFKARVVVPKLNGNLQAVRDARVTLLGNDGVTYQGRTDANGKVTIRGVEPGVYAMTTRGRDCFACYAMHVLPSNTAADQQWPNTAEISAAPITSERFEALVLPHLSSQFDRERLSLQDDSAQRARIYVRDDVDFQVARSGGGLTGYLYEASERSDRKVEDNQNSPLNSAEETKVFLLKDGVNVGDDISDEAGRFEFADLELGVYSLLMVGPKGLGAVGFELINGDRRLQNTAATSSGTRRLIKQVGANDPQDVFAMQVIPMSGSELQTILNEPLDGPVLPITTSPLAVGGGGGGGGGAISGAGAAGTSMGGLGGAARTAAALAGAAGNTQTTFGRLGAAHVSGHYSD